MRKDGGTTESHSPAVFHQDPNSLAYFATECYPANKHIEVLRDTSISGAPITTPFYGHCESKTVEHSRKASINEVNTGVVYVTERTCVEMDGSFIEGFILILTQDVHSKGYEYVPCPALLFAEDTNSRITVAKEYISLNKDGSDGTYLWIQK